MISLICSLYPFISSPLSLCPISLYSPTSLLPHPILPPQAYLSILYLKPRTQIILRQKNVHTKLVAKSLSHIENDVYKPQFNVSLSDMPAFPRFWF